MLHLVEVVLQETAFIKPQQKWGSNDDRDLKIAERPKVLLCELPKLLRPD